MTEPGFQRRRPRLVGVIVIALAVALILVGLGSIALDQGNDNPIEIEGAGTVQKLIAGIPQDGAVLGPSSAPVTVQVFNDLQCQDCDVWQLRTIDPLIEDQVRGGEIKLDFHHFSLGERSTQIAAYAATDAGLQGRQWQYIDLFFRNQDQAEKRGVTQDLLEQVAQGVLELDVPRWRDQFDDPEVADIVTADSQLAAERRLPAQPAVVVFGPGGSRELIESPTLDEVQRAIDAVS